MSTNTTCHICGCDEQHVAKILRLKVRSTIDFEWINIDVCDICLENAPQGFRFEARPVEQPYTEPWQRFVEKWSTP